MRSRPKRRSRLAVEELESRAVPAGAVWPFPGGPATNPLLETWGQYQDLPNAPWDMRVHFHEGIDIKAAPETPVKAVMAGEVIDFAERGFASFVVIQDEPGGKK